MSKSIFEIWLSFGNGAEKLRLPVLPSILDISNESKNESVDIAKLGEVTIIQDPAAKVFSFSSHFPPNESSITEYTGFKMPWRFVQDIERWKRTGRPIRFLVTGTPINFPVSIESFTYREGEGDIKDLYYDITLKEYLFVTVRKIDLKKPVPVKARPDPKLAPKSHVVKKGDTLWALAKKYYGNSLQWKKLWEANKAGLIKRDSRNLKQPGHWLHISYKLVIPA